MILCVMELYGYELEETTTEEWTDTIDRGGLWHINDNVYHLFYLMELEIRQYFIVSELRNTDEDTRARITDTLLSNDNLCVQWILATSQQQIMNMHFQF